MIDAKKKRKYMKIMVQAMEDADRRCKEISDCEACEFEGTCDHNYHTPYASIIYDNVISKIEPDKEKDIEIEKLKAEQKIIQEAFMRIIANAYTQIRKDVIDEIIKKYEESDFTLVTEGDEDNFQQGYLTKDIGNFFKELKESE